MSISNAPSNSSPFSGSVCFSLKKQLGHFKSQSGLYSSTTAQSLPKAVQMDRAQLHSRCLLLPILCLQLQSQA